MSVCELVAVPEPVSAPEAMTEAKVPAELPPFDAEIVLLSTTRLLAPVTPPPRVAPIELVVVALEP